MTFRSTRKARAWGFPPATHTFTTRELDIEMSDGVVLKATHWRPDLAAGEPPAPLIIQRTPYGRRIAPNEVMLLAERGYQVLVVSCRGTFGSGGELRIFANEQRDGLDTFAWIEQQPWFPGRAVTIGASYVGMTQWAVAAKRPEWLRGHCMAITTSELHDGAAYPQGVFAQETLMSWLWSLNIQERSDLVKWPAFLFQLNRIVRRAGLTRPLIDADHTLVDHELPDLRSWLASESADAPYWHSLPGFDEDVADMRPVAVTSGWHDIFVGGQLLDAARLAEAGVPFRLEIGPWHHSSPGLYPVTMKMWFDFVEAHLKDVDAAPLTISQTPIRLHLGGAGGIHDIASWPPPATDRVWHVGAGGALQLEPGTGTATYRYDPADPTPSRGGRNLNPWHAGAKNQKQRERRADVLTFTTATLAEDLTVVGEGAVELRVRPSHHEVDYVAVLCEVEPKGRSVNVTDGVLRLSTASAAPDADGWLTLRVPLSPTGHRFAAGTRVRLQISSGAFPLLPRNLGSGGSFAEASEIVPSTHEVDLAATRLVVPEWQS